MGKMIKYEVGQIINGLELLKDLGTLFPTKTSKTKKRYGIFKCNCGKEFRAIIRSVKRGNTSSCGCYNKQQTIERSTKHSMCGTRLYNVWNGMKQRCTNPNNPRYKDYGERGITLCEEWIQFEPFMQWAIKNGYDESLSIDRIDNDGNYCHENCRWSNMTVQARNTRKLKINNTSGFRGVSFQRGKWVARIGIKGKSVFLGRFNTPEEAAEAYDNYITENNLEHTKNFEGE